MPKLKGSDGEIAIEVQGGLHIRGRHNRTNASMEQDFEKIAAATMAGYTVILCSTEQATNGTVLRWLTEGSNALDQRWTNRRIRGGWESIAPASRPPHSNGFQSGN